MLIEHKPPSNLDRLRTHISTQHVFAGKPSIPVDAYRQGDTILVHLDLSGEVASGIEVRTEEGILTLRIQTSSTIQP